MKTVFRPVAPSGRLCYRKARSMALWEERGHMRRRWGLRAAREGWRFFLLVAGTLCFVLSVRSFIMPNHLLSGGVTGLSLLLNAVFRTPVGLVVLIFNAPIFLLGGRGVTILKAEGAYTGSVSDVLLCIVTRFELRELRDIIRSEDPSAFVTVIEVSDVIGRFKRPSAFSIWKRQQKSGDLEP